MHRHTYILEPFSKFNEDIFEELKLNPNYILLVIAMIVFPQAYRSLAEPHSYVSVQFVTALISASQRARGMPLFLVPPPIPKVIDFSKLFSLLMKCPKYDSCCFFIISSSGLKVLISSPITDLFVRLAVNGIRGSFLQQHNSNMSILLLSVFLTVHDSQHYSTTGKTKAFTILHCVVFVISLSVMSCLSLSLPLCLI